MKCIVSGLVALIASAQECDPTTGVCDMHERCSAWKDEGECLRNRAYMQKHCPVSCSEEATATSMIHECIDQHDRCKVWARLGECEANPVEMHKYCPRSCKVCSEQGVAIQDEEEEEFEEEDTCQDRDTRCGSWARSGECTSNPNYMHFNCAVSCGTCEKVTAVAAPKKTGKSATTSAYADNLMERSKKFGELQQATGADRERVLSRIESTISYLASDEVGQLSANIRRECKNRHELCSFWQVIGECEKNKAYMQTNCAAACQSCKMIDHSTRCPPLPDAVPGLIPGGVNQMFERIVRTAPGNRTDMMDEEFRALEESKIPLYSVHVHSRPSEEPLTEVSVAQDKALPPWVITFDNFLTDEECENLIELGYKYGYKRSEDVGGVRFDGTFDSVQSSSRTSENAWCSHTECRDEEVPKRLHERMAKVMGIPPEHSEDLQVRTLIMST